MSTRKLVYVKLPDLSLLLLDIGFSNPMSYPTDASEHRPLFEGGEILTVNTHHTSSSRPYLIKSSSVISSVQQIHWLDFPCSCTFVLVLANVNKSCR